MTDYHGDKKESWFCNQRNVNMHKNSEFHAELEISYRESINLNEVCYCSLNGA